MVRSLLAIAALCWTAGAPAQEELRLIEQEPHDLITLNDANDNAVLRVFPLDLPTREVPKPRPGEKLLVRLLDRPDSQYEVAYTSIDKIELFEQRVLDEVREFVKAGRFHEAYEYLEYLLRRYPRTPGLNEAIEESLYEEAKARHRAGKYDGALAVLRELYARNKERPELDRAMGVTTEALVKQYVERDEHAAARELLGNLRTCYPEHEIAIRWEETFRQEAEALRDEARTALAPGAFRKADLASRRMYRIWPRLDGADDLIEEVRRKYPRVVVGVTMPAVQNRADRIDDWAARRTGRLVQRLLMEFAAPGADGGRYRCPYGTFQIEELGRRLVFQVRPKVRLWEGEGELTGYDLARQLLAMADPASAEYRPGWAELAASVRVNDVFQVDVDLRWAHVRPEALLRTVLLPPSAPTFGSPEADPTGGPYRVLSRDDGEVSFVVNPDYFAANDAQPKEIVERVCPKATQAIRDLKAGRIDVLDRVNPWDLGRLRKDGRFTVETYGIPLVHVLVPNMGKPLSSNRRFRRALAYGIHREAILEHLCGGERLPGCRVLSAPVPVGITPDDPLGYAYDRTVEPRQYDPRLALALARVAVEEVTAAERELGREWTPPRQLVLAHPPHEYARSACKVLQRQLKLIDLPVVLREIHPGEVAADHEAVDLVYAELAVCEPVSDAARILGEHGLVGACSPYMSLALAEVERAPGWKEASQILSRIHRLAYDDVAVVPLWQTAEHLAYRKGLQGVGERPIALYEQVEQWRAAEAEKP